MTVPVHVVAKAILDRRRDVEGPALAHLLYLCQGHHLGWFAQLMFTESIYVTDHGVAIADLEPAADRPTMDNSRLNTVGFVLSRYGNLPARDLLVLIRAQSPYQLADAGRQPGGRAVIDPDVVRRHFAAALAVERAETGIPEDAVSDLIAGARDRLNDPLRPDDLVALRAKVVDHAR